MTTNIKSETTKNLSATKCFNPLFGGVENKCGLGTGGLSWNDRQTK